MNNVSPEIDVLKYLYNDLYDALRGDLIADLLIQDLHSDFKRRHDLHDGLALKVAENSVPDLYRCLQEVKETLQFDEKVDLYIVRDAEINASASYSFNEEYPHIVRLNSSLVQILSNDELKYIIGHEIGHLINGDANIGELLLFLYGDPETADYPPFIKLRKNLYDQLCELSADRYGYIACGDLDTSIAAEYKSTAGLDLTKLNVNISELVRNNEELVKLFIEGNGEMTGDHPVAPIRVHALQVYANAKSQEELDEKMSQIINCYYKVNEEDSFLFHFAAIAGLYMANRDGHVTDDERSRILNAIGTFVLNQNDIIKEVEEGDINQSFEEIINQWSETPEYAYLAESMLDYFIAVAFVDKEITEEEMNSIFELGYKLGFTFEIISTKVADAIRGICIPKTL